MELFSYFRSSAAYRLRIAFNLKGIAHDIRPVNLLKAEHKSEEYLAMNPQGLVPALKIDDGRVLTQSTAILEYIEATQAGQALLPSDEFEAAIVRSWVNQIACDIHPVNNLRILKYLSGELGVDDDAKNSWYKHWIDVGFRALEEQLGDGPFCYGEQVTLADVYLVPQVYNAKRFQVDMSQFPKISAIVDHCNRLDAFVQAMPEHQPDAPQS
ncbi:maleylacetoacetate isomerase [Pseudoteredinibacter isoporae]|uniref:maleylacetoacetate isomerase n=1 Tax=Pseudoteredinibacter isoporae TaxID=570281 RepID=UPI00310AA223